MHTGVCCVAVLVGAMGFAAGATAGSENNSNLAPLISNVKNHNSHFHIFLNTPAAVGINTTHQLLADASSASPTDSVSSSNTTLQTEAQGLLDYAQTITNTGDELMFTMDVPYVPAQVTPIVLAQAAAPGAGTTLQPDYILTTCKQTESAGDPMSAMRGVDPAGILRNYIQNQVHHYIDIAGITNTTMLEDTTHGKLIANTSGSGSVYFMYEPVSGYVGNDKAVFMAEYGGKQYKIVVELHVFTWVNEKLPSTCPPPQLIKVNGKPVSGSSSYDLNTTPVTFADLSGSALGQTNANGITLDTNNNRGQTTFSIE